MKLITDAILAKLKANHAKANETGEFGTISLSELKALKFPPFNLPVERDRHFRGGSVDEFNKYYEEHNSLNGC